LVYKVGKTGSGSLVTTLDRDYCRMLGIKPGTKTIQEMRGNTIVIRRLA
jgi:hypothetical protein